MSLSDRDMHLGVTINNENTNQRLMIHSFTIQKGWIDGAADSKDGCRKKMKTTELIVESECVDRDAEAS